MFNFGNILRRKNNDREPGTRRVEQIGPDSEQLPATEPTEIGDHLVRVARAEARLAKLAIDHQAIETVIDESVRNGNGFDVAALDAVDHDIDAAKTAKARSVASVNRLLDPKDAAFKGTITNTYQIPDSADH